MFLCVQACFKHTRLFLIHQDVFLARVTAFFSRWDMFFHVRVILCGTEVCFWRVPGTAVAQRPRGRPLPRPRPAQTRRQGQTCQAAGEEIRQKGGDWAPGSLLGGVTGRGSRSSRRALAATGRPWGLLAVTRRATGSYWWGFGGYWKALRVTGRATRTYWEGFWELHLGFWLSLGPY